MTFKIIYHPDYDLNLGDHVFPSVKYRLIRERLLRDGIAAPADFLKPELIADEDLYLVHGREWVRRVKNNALTDYDVLRLEIPVSPEMIRGFLLAAGGSLLAARNALVDGMAYNIGGGFHHAYPDHGEGFCAIHDVAVALLVLIRDNIIRKALVIDCDVHHGNGTAAIFAGDDSVYTMSIHQWANYPAVKPPSDLDVHLEDGVKDAEYLEKLRKAYVPALDSVKPDLVAYVAGADPYREDRLGGLRLTIDGLKARDRVVLDAAAERGIPAVITLAGGYAVNVDDTVTIHVNTLVAAREALEQHPRGGRGRSVRESDGGQTPPPSPGGAAPPPR